MQSPDADLSTYERTDLEDFLWYTEDVLYNGVPADAAIIDNVKYTTGGWKGLIIYDPDKDYGECDGVSQCEYCGHGG